MSNRARLPEEKGYWSLLALALLFAVMTAFFQPVVAAVEGAAAIALYFVLRGALKRRDRQIMEYIKGRSNDIEAATRGTIMNAPLPMVIFQPDTDEIIWSNERFLAMTGNPDHLFDVRLSEVVPDFQHRWITDGKSQAPKAVEVQGEQYLVFGNLIDTDNQSGNLAISYWVNITRYALMEEKYLGSRPVAAVLLIDNYEDLMRGIEESERSVLLSDLNKRISQWAEPARGILCRYDRDHYLFIFEQAYLEVLQRQKFSILESVRQVRSPNAVTATLSIGMGADAPTMRELYQYAVHSMEMALSRGGDQLVMKNQEKFEFFGGKAKESERRTKVKSRVVSNALSELLVGASQVLIMGHAYPDMDVVGAAAGMVAIARKRKVPVFIIRDLEPSPGEEVMDRLAELSEYESVLIDHEEAPLILDDNTLVVVVDTNRPEQVQMPELLQRAKRVVLVDHHRRAATYIENPVLSFEDPYASSASELVAELMQHILEPGDLLRQEAEAVLAGIVLDTKNFTLRTGSRTFEAAAYLRKQGADSTQVRKFFQSDLAGTVTRYGIVRQASEYRPGVAIACAQEPVGRITAAKAADELLNISGIGASFVLFETPEHQVMLSARSSSNINVQLISEKLGGGGNAAAAGAQIKNISLLEAKTKLQEAIDQYFEEN